MNYEINDLFFIFKVLWWSRWSIINEDIVILKYGNGRLSGL